MLYLLNYAQAVADPDITAIATSTATVLSENILASVQAVIPLIIGIIATVFVFGFVVRFFKRNVGGR